MIHIRGLDTAQGVLGVAILIVIFGAITLILLGVVGKVIGLSQSARATLMSCGGGFGVLTFIILFVGELILSIDEKQRRAAAWGLFQVIAVFAILWILFRRFRRRNPLDPGT